MLNLFRRGPVGRHRWEDGGVWSPGLLAQLAFEGCESARRAMVVGNEYLGVPRHAA